MNYIPVREKGGIYDGLTGEYLGEKIEDIKREDLIDSIFDDLENFIKAEKGSEDL